MIAHSAIVFVATLALCAGAASIGAEPEANQAKKIDFRLTAPDHGSDLQLGDPVSIERSEAWYWHEDERVGNFKLYSVRLSFGGKDVKAIEQFTKSLPKGSLVVLTLSGKKVSQFSLMEEMTEGRITLTARSKRRHEELMKDLTWLIDLHEKTE